MLKEARQNLYHAIEEARQFVGDSAPLIADQVIPKVFPQGHEVAQEEGFDDLLRRGVISVIKVYIRKPKISERQMSFNDIAPDILPLVRKLNSTSYFVPSAEGCSHDEDVKVTGFHVPVAELCTNLENLEAACVFMETKASEVSKEAQKLRDIYDALSQTELALS